MKTYLYLLAFLVVAIAARANTPADYAYTFPIDTGAQDGSAWRFALTPEVYAWAQDRDLRDIEVFNAAGQPIPFARAASATPSTQRQTQSALPLLPLPASAAGVSASDLRLVIDRDASGRLRRIDAGEQTPQAATAAVRDWIVDASGFDHAIDTLSLTWAAPATGVVARLDIAAGDDLQTWRPVGSGTVLALEQDGAKLERHDIDIAHVRARYLRLHRSDDGTEFAGLSVHARALERDVAAPARTWLDARPLPTVATNPPDDRREPPFDYTLMAAVPVAAARIELTNDNALATLTLLGRSDATATWTELARSTAFRLKSGEEILQNGDIAFALTPRLREFRLVASAPLAATPRLALDYRPDDVVFLAEGAGPYSLAVGSVRAQHADYPVDAALTSLREKLGPDWQPPIARLGAATPSSGIAALTPPAPSVPWQRYLLWAVLAVAALLVGGLAVSLLRGGR
ncbi:MAG: DUF3999 domain-containing protein [Rhodanobacter sp.]|jgi:hypothetical protein|nr:DUF3999 domain-containing protein [Rhodanobacter sp.]